jgi:hypothetical protein
MSIAARLTIRCINQPMSNALVRKDGSAKRLQVRGRLKKALSLMIWGDGERRYLSDNEAAVRTGMNVKSIRQALQLAHVQAYYRQQRDVLRERESAASIHRLCEIRDAADNMPAVQSARTLLGDNLDQPRSFNTESPHLTIRIVNQPIARAAPTIEHKPIEPETTDPWDATKPLAPARFRDPTRDDL